MSAVNADNSGSSNDDSGLSNELSSMSIDSSSSSKKKNTCLCCLKEVDGLQGCSRCLTARYCGKACQVKHWPVHKNSCRDSNDTEDNNEKLNIKALNHSKQGNSVHIYQMDIIITNIIIVGNYAKAEKLYSKLLHRLRKKLGERFLCKGER
jgi:hypothetical protein